VRRWSVLGIAAIALALLVVNAARADPSERLAPVVVGVVVVTLVILSLRIPPPKPRRGPGDLGGGDGGGFDSNHHGDGGHSGK
jgi:hypothetical protein